MKRYRWVDYAPGHEVSSAGDWVRYEDAQAEIERLRMAHHKIRDRYLLALGKGEEATGALVLELAGYAAAALDQSSQDRCPGRRNEKPAVLKPPGEPG
jgi:hypothetical protein